MEMIKTEGVGMEKITKKNITREMNHSVPKFMLINGNYYMVAHVNTTGNKSDVGNRVIADMYPCADFSVSYSIEDRSDSTVFSLRSTNKHFDVSVIAKHLGGGGHRNASGVKVGCVTSTLPGEVLDNGKIYDKINKLYFDKIEINAKEYNIVYLNLSSLKSKVGKYLLRKRYYIKKDDGEKIEYQVCQCINKILTSKDIAKVDLAGVWSYDGQTNKTTFSITFEKEIDDYKKEMILMELNGVMYGDTLIVTANGLVKKIP